MGTKPTWNRASFAARVMMSHLHSLWIVVEGDDVDPAFYSLVTSFSEKPRVRASRVIPVDQTIRGADHEVGGRQAVVEAFAHYRDANQLVQANGSGNNVMVFVVDYDLEDLGPQFDDDHLLVTCHRDVESDVIASSDRARAVAAATGKDSVDASGAAEVVERMLSAVADDWHRWIVLGVASQGVNPIPKSLKFSLSPETLARQRRTTLVDLVATSEGRLRAAFLSEDDFTQALADAETFVDHVRQVQGPLGVLKGKWLIGPITVAIKNHFGENNPFATSVGQRLLAAMTAVIRQESTCVEEYLRHFEGFFGESDATAA